MAPFGDLAPVWSFSPPFFSPAPVCFKWERQKELPVFCFVSGHFTWPVSSPPTPRCSTAAPTGKFVGHFNGHRRRRRRRRLDCSASCNYGALLLLLFFPFAAAFFRLFFSLFLQRNNLPGSPFISLSSSLSLSVTLSPSWPTLFPRCALNGFNECGPINFFAAAAAGFSSLLPPSLLPTPSVNNNWVSRQRRHLNFKFNCNFSLSLSLSFGFAFDLSSDCNLKLIFIIAFFDVSQKMWNVRFPPFPRDWFRSVYYAARSVRAARLAFPAAVAAAAVIAFQNGDQMEIMRHCQRHRCEPNTRQVPKWSQWRRRGERCKRAEAEEERAKSSLPCSGSAANLPSTSLIW